MDGIGCAQGGARGRTAGSEENPPKPENPKRPMEQKQKNKEQLEQRPKSYFAFANQTMFVEIRVAFLFDVFDLFGFLWPVPGPSWQRPKDYDRNEVRMEEPADGRRVPRKTTKGPPPKKEQLETHKTRGLYIRFCEFRVFANHCVLCFEVFWFPLARPWARSWRSQTKSSAHRPTHEHFQRTCRLGEAPRVRKRRKHYGRNWVRREGLADKRRVPRKKQTTENKKHNRKPKQRATRTSTKTCWAGEPRFDC